MSGSSERPGAAEVIIRPLKEADLPAADEVLRTAFDTFIGVESLFGDIDYMKRWFAAPDSALAAELDGELVGSNFLTAWGSVAFFGPLSVRPELWNRGIAGRLVEATVERFDKQHIRQAGLYTFSNSAKHHGLYQKYGFWPRFLTPILTRQVGGLQRGAPEITRYTSLSAADQEKAIEGCRQLTATAFEGLDLEREIRAVGRLALGEVILLDDLSGLAGMAVCHIGAGTEAGSDFCYVKFGMVRPGPGAADRLDALLGACEALATSQGAHEVELGINTARHEAYRTVLARGYRVGTVGVGVAMHRPNEQGYSRPGVWLVDDWR
jgi:predicted N-acetyltransferase YhbS